MVFLPGLGLLCLLWDSGCQTTKFGEDVIKLLPHLFALFPIHHSQFGVSPQEPSVGPTDNRRHDLQIAQQFLSQAGRRWRFDFPLGFEKQLRLFQNPSSHLGRCLSPSDIQLLRLPIRQLVPDYGGRQPLAILPAGTSHRHQVFHGYLRRDLAGAHLLLHAFRNQFH
jgi:hypothetical protein